MENSMIIEDFGPRVTSVWNGLRPATRHLVERAWRSPAAATTAEVTKGAPYDPRADRELSQLLAALDERATSVAAGTEDQSSCKARRLADACANMLSQQTQSAEVFAQLIERAHTRQEYALIDQLANGMSMRLAPSELCEMARSGNVVVRALANEVLAQAPPSLLKALLLDPIDAEVARSVLERQAHEFGLEDARRVLHEYEEFGN
ncbi:MAG TPA: hypothetical protein VJT71_13980 [Pyrinomonadaceae bacterium]|nr:hypothetical protein [Pyrinomonadaceae bacterium]